MTDDTMETLLSETLPHRLMCWVTISTWMWQDDTVRQVRGKSLFLIVARKFTCSAGNNYIEGMRIFMSDYQRRGAWSPGLISIFRFF